MALQDSFITAQSANTSLTWSDNSGWLPAGERRVFNGSISAQERRMNVNYVTPGVITPFLSYTYNPPLDISLDRISFLLPSPNSGTYLMYIYTQGVSHPLYYTNPNEPIFSPNRIVEKVSRLEFLYTSKTELTFSLGVLGSTRKREENVQPFPKGLSLHIKTFYSK